MDRIQKEQAIAALKQTFEDTEAVVVTQYAGLTVGEMSDLRNKMRECGVSYKVSKNRLVLRALEGTRFEGIGEMLKGPVAIATSKDPVAGAKVIWNFAKDNDNLKVLGGALGEEIMDVSGIESLSKLPSLDEIRAKFVALLQTPATRIARLSKEPAGQMARVIKAYADKG